MLDYKNMMSDYKEQVIKDSVLNVKDWIDKAIEGKFSNCKGRLAKRRREELIKKGEKMIPASEDDLCKNALADPNYKDRLARDLEDERKRTTPK